MHGMSSITFPQGSMALDEVIQGFMSIDSEYMKLQMAARSPHSPGLPHRPLAAPHWEALGSFMGMDPHEVAIVMEHALGNPSEITRAALKHLLLVAKLEAGEKVGVHRSKQAVVLAEYERRQAKYEKDTVRAEAAKLKLATLVAERDAVFRGSWVALVDDFQARCVVADHRLSRMDPTLVKALYIVVRHSKHVNINDQDPEDKLLIIDWSMLYRFKGPHVATILREFKHSRIFGE